MVKGQLPWKIHLKTLIIKIYDEELTFVINYLEIMLPEARLRPSQISLMELLCENSQRPEAVNYSRKEAPSQIFDREISMPLGTAYILDHKCIR